MRLGDVKLPPTTPVDVPKATPAPVYSGRPGVKALRGIAVTGLLNPKKVKKQTHKRKRSHK